MVMLLKPVVSFGPVIVNDTKVVAGGYDVIVVFDICEVVMFPVIESVTFTPLSVVAVTFVADGVEVGDSVEVGAVEGLGVTV